MEYYLSCQHISQLRWRSPKGLHMSFVSFIKQVYINWNVLKLPRICLQSRRSNEACCWVAKKIIIMKKCSQEDRSAVHFFKNCLRIGLYGVFHISSSVYIVYENATVKLSVVQTSFSLPPHLAKKLLDAVWALTRSK